MKQLSASLLNGLCACSLTSLLIFAGCGGTQSPSTPLSPPADSQGNAASALPAIDIAALPQIQSASGMTEGVLGIFWLTRDPADPTRVTLEPNRSAAAVSQGDLYALSVRPYLRPDSLELLSTTPVAGGKTDYNLRFRHPFDLPADFNPPATASKRLDLFIFDVQMVVAIAGPSVFFDASIKANIHAASNMSGYRQFGPIVDLSQLGIVDGTNVFPFRLLHRIDPGNPAGNYGTDGWIAEEYLDARGYDVIPQGASADGTIRLANSVPASVPIIVMAKYMDPRAGVTPDEKRANRLPNENPANLRYYLPEAAGDLQNIAVQVTGALRDNSSSDTATIKLTVLDWDNAATIAPEFPDVTNINAISEPSRPTNIEASFPMLKASGSFPYSSIGTPTGSINEYIDITIPVKNIDQSFTAPPEGMVVEGLVRVRDEQDATNPAPTILDENLVPYPSWPGFEPATRFQVVHVTVQTGAIAPEITEVAPLTGISGQTKQFTATNLGGEVTSWTWGFGGGANPNTSTEASPTVMLGEPGTYTCVVRATNPSGEQLFYFDLEVEVASPIITKVDLSTLFARRPCTFTATNEGEPATSWLWNFGGGATPNTSTAASPAVRLTKPGTFTGSVIAGNAGGEREFEFEYTTVTKKIGLRMQVITSGTTFPKKLYGMSNWDEAGVKAWVQQRVNGPFHDAGIEIDLDQLEFIPVNNPALFNIDTQAEVNQLWNLALGQNPNKLNTVVINAVPSSPGLGGVMTDTSCNPNNNGRGCWVISWGADFDIVVMAHELGHVMNLPHVRTGSPLNSNNYNLMSYGTLSTALFESAPREEAPSCITYSGAAPFNQFHVSNDWVHTYM